LARALPVLERDVRIAGVAAGGSYITGELDEFSDLDLVLVVAPDATEAVNAARIDIARSLGRLLSGFTGEHVGEPRLIVCLYDAPLLHVDLKFVSLDDFPKRVEDPTVLFERDRALTRALAREPAVFPKPGAQWIEDRFWIWIHYAATKVSRGELFEAGDFLAFLRAQALAPLAAALKSENPRGVRRLEHAHPEHLADFDRTLAARTPQSCLDALTAAVALYRKLRDAAGAPHVERRAETEHAATAYLASLAKPLGRE
jgi:predicted nucleotidyltransferase